MTHIKLKPPIPKKKFTPVLRGEYRTGRPIRLYPPKSLPKTSFVEVVRSRSTSYEMAPLSESKLNDFLWISARTLETKRLKSGQLWQHKMSPSAGGLHAIDLMIQNSPFDPFSMLYFDSFGMTLKPLLNFGTQDLKKSQKHAMSIVKEGEATLIWLVAQFQVTAAKYQNPESLLLRDAGAYITSAYLTASFLKLKCCALGTIQNPIGTKSHTMGKNLMGVGALYVGS